MNKGAWVAAVLGTPAVLVAVYQLAAAAFVTTTQLDSSLQNWGAEHKAAVMGRLDEQAKQLEAVSDEARAAAKLGEQTHRLADSLVCGLVQKGKAVGDLCVLPSGARRALGATP